MVANSVHAHYCDTCEGYSRCEGWNGARTYSLDVTCLLPEDCVQCGKSLQGTASVKVGA